MKGIVGKNAHGREYIQKMRQNNANTKRAIKGLLKMGGYPEDYLDYHYYCPKCCDYGYRDGVKCQCFTDLLKKYTTEELNENCSIQLHDFSEFRIEFYPESDGNGMSPREKMRTVSPALDFVSDLLLKHKSLFCQHLQNCSLQISVPLVFSLLCFCQLPVLVFEHPERISWTGI